MDSRRSRWGWSSNWGRGPISPFSSGLGRDGQAPDVQDDDFSYITSEDLQNHQAEQSRYYYPAPSNAHEPGLEMVDDDIILIKFKGVTYPSHFPAYSIADGKVWAVDIRERLQIMVKLNDDQTKRLRLYYKGKELTDDEVPAARYGVKNKSEVLVVLPDESAEDGSSESSEEIVVVQGDAGESIKKKPKDKSGRRGDKDRMSRNSPRDSSSGVNLSVPDVGDDRKGSTSRSHSPAPSATTAPKSPTYPPAEPGSPMDTLNKLVKTLEDLRPMCDEFINNPPTESKKLNDEHRRLGEILLQQVLLKLDGVSGDDEIRNRRKDAVRQTQALLSELDKVHAAEVKKAG